jgi:glycosyltransferase involved in cell wall biosynthesis
VDKGLLIVIPAKNEAETIVQLLHQLRLAGWASVVVIDDHSDDGTGELARGAGAHVLHPVLALGAWGGMQTGIRYGLMHGFSGVITMDADGQHEVEESLDIDRKITKANQEITDNSLRIVAMQEAIKRNPNSLKFDLQIFSTDGKDRFMPPMIQIVGAESQIAEAKLLISKLKADKLKLEITSKFYESSTKLLENVSGKFIFSKLVDLKKIYFKSFNANERSTIEALNEIETEIETRRKTYFQDFRFISGPTLPSEKTKVSTLKVIFTSAIPGLMLMILLSFFAKWWRKNINIFNSPVKFEN